MGDRRIVTRNVKDTSELFGGPLTGDIEVDKTTDFMVQRKAELLLLSEYATALTQKVLSCSRQVLYTSATQNTVGDGSHGTDLSVAWAEQITSEPVPASFARTTIGA